MEVVQDLAFVVAFVSFHVMCLLLVVLTIWLCLVGLWRSWTRLSTAFVVSWNASSWVLLSLRNVSRVVWYFASS